MKRLVVFAIALALVGCESEDRGNNPVVHDTVTVKIDSGTMLRDTVRTHMIVYDTIKSRTVKDTNITVKKAETIVGSVVNKENKSGVSVVVCSEIMGKCARTNSAGLYQISKSKIAARSLAMDTTQTPENVVSSGNDTTTKTINAPAPNIDTTSDTMMSTKMKISGNDTLVIDSIATIDTIKVELKSDTIKVDIVTVVPDSVNDTLAIISNGTILKEIPIVSWGDVLGPQYIVQRDISAIDSTPDGIIRNVEAVYFMNSDSVAKVVTLEKQGRDFSGFIYTIYDDISYRNEKKIYNIFIRGKDSIGRIVVKTDIESFSEKLGDVPTKVLKNKVSVPQWMIPSISKVPNNTEIPEFIQTYKETSDTGNYWIGIEMTNIRTCLDLHTVNIGRPDCMTYAGIRLGYDSLSVELNADGDSILFERPMDQGVVTGFKNSQANEFTEYKIDILGNGIITIRQTASNARPDYRNIKFRVRKP